MAASNRVLKRRCLLVKKAMLLPRQRRQTSLPRGRGSRPAARRFVRPQLEKLEDRVVLNYSFGSTPFQWVELNGDPNATNLIGTGDDWANPIDLGSNTINFYGTTYSGFGGPSGIWASTNGLITFGSGDSDFFNGDLQTNPGQAAISPLWDDYFKFSGSPMVLSEVDAANNRLIVEWNQVNDTVTSNPVTFEAIIQLNTGSTPGNIVFNYLQLGFLIVSKNPGTRADLLSPQQVSGFFEQVSRNTDYIIHPEEILAENFALLMIGRRDVPSPDLLDRLRRALGQK